ncbi:prolyl oligopeptidase family serine peptidase [Mesorhizobium australicum]|uniref:prolyl oligopeptidase family serine peptidase n=1 Tax=Mesorhizobium australicum TaxID=536018 RepID=UPI003EBCB399
MITLAEHAVAAANTELSRAEGSLCAVILHVVADMTAFDFRPTLNAPDDDPYLWLEDIEGERALDWTASQSARTLGLFGGTQFQRDRAALTAIFDRPDKTLQIKRHGHYLYNFWQDARNRRGLWRRSTLACYMKAEPQWEALLDLDAVAVCDGEDWIWAGTSIEPERRERAVLRLSRGGSDAVVHREFDLKSLSFVADGFNLADAKGGVNWLDPDTLLLSSAFGDGMATRSGYARTVRLWKRGANPLTAPVIFETGSESLGVSGHLDRTAGSERLWLIEQSTFLEKMVQIGDRSGPKIEIDLPRDAWCNSSGGWLAVKPRKPWTVGGMTHAADALIGISLSSFIAGEPSLAALFESGDRRSLQSFFWNDGKLIISYLVKLDPRLEMFTPDRQEWTRRALDTVPAGALFSTIPLTDMHRYTKLLAGASWKYGDPDKPDDWTFLKEISAYHAAAPGQPYPPILLATTKRDDRVHPGHARKMAAKLSAIRPCGRARLRQGQPGADRVHCPGYNSFAVRSAGKPISVDR